MAAESYANVCTITGPATAVAGPRVGGRVLFDPGEPASVRLLGGLDIVEDADRRHGVIRA